MAKAISHMSTLAFGIEISIWKQSISNREGITGTRPNHANRARERRSVGKRKQDKAVDDLREQIDMLDKMLSSLVDVLEAKGIARHAEWEKRVKERLGSK